ncbi:unnamed protein product [Chilo suppressalis]|uniref:Neurotransmitter-gated ion-channel ligand-binding domain-containing protein n=1 Tax=Chilo suppressalis TaxID=168631 RepID=A0ABN8L936_CHISP|nr:unnamed protein product [Chilo suppressalis]
MKWLKSCFVYLLVIFPSKAAALNGSTFVYTYAMAMQCKEHFCQEGYSYSQFYEVDSEDTKHSTSTTDYLLEMHIAIQAVNNGHILLSSKPYPTINDSVYEIVVGGGSNRFTELRRNLKRNAKASKATSGILSAIELRGFVIRVSRGSYPVGRLIEFGEEGATLPILSYLDMNPIDIRYFSFAAWAGVDAKFLYDCPAVGDMTNQTLPHSKAVERKLSNSDRLKKEMLQDRPPHMAPGPSVPVNLSVLISGITYDALEAKLITRMTILTIWKDETLSWNPDKFNNITSVTYRQGQVWRPIFHIFNSDSLDALQTTGHEEVNMLYSGEASFHFKATVDTWCYTESSDINWPRDKYNCTIVVQPWEAHEKITLSAITKATPIIKSFSDYDEWAENEWQILSWSQTVVASDVWDLLYPTQNNATHRSDRLVIQVEIQRHATTYNIVFYTPLIVLMVFVLMSFWSEQLKMSRVWFYAGASIVICTGLCYIDYVMPCHIVPSILTLYITVLDAILGALVLQVFLMTPIAEKLCKTMVMQNILSSKYFRSLYCLPVLMVCRNYNSINEGFLSQEDDSAMPTPGNGNIEEMQEVNNKFCEKEELAEAVDKTLFAVYSILFAVLLALHY